MTYFSMAMMGMVIDTSGADTSVAGLAHHIRAATFGMGKIYNAKLELYSAIVCLLTIIVNHVVSYV